MRGMPPFPIFAVRMKPRIVEVAVKSHRVERSVGDAPTIGRVSKLGDLEPVARGERRRKRHDGKHEGEKVDRLMRLMVIAASLVGLGLLLTFLFFWAKNMWGGNVAAAPTNRASSEIIVPNATVEVQPVSFDEHLALDRMSRALATRHAGKVPDYFRVAETTRPDEVIAFLEGMQTRDGLVVGLKAMPGIRANGISLGQVMVDTEFDGHRKQRLALWIYDAERGWRIDFASFARVTEPSWAALLEGPPKEGIVRVIVRPEVNGLSDQKVSWESWIMHSPDLETEMHAHCRAGSVQATAMQAMRVSEADERSKRAALVVRQMEGKPRGNFEILRVIAEDWVISEQAYDERFPNR